MAKKGKPLSGIAVGYLKTQVTEKMKHTMAVRERHWLETQWQAALSFSNPHNISPVPVV